MPRIPTWNTVLTAALAAALLPAAALAQGRSDTEQVCLRFSFGQWTPTLDWRAAGHTSRIDPSVHQQAAVGRDWATTDATMHETQLLLLPSWWPAGVNVTLPTRRPAMGDTVSGSAFAFVADGRRVAPVSKVRAWRVECR